jgi:hypothetical protein
MKIPKTNIQTKLLLTLIAGLVIFVLFNFNTLKPIDHSINPAEEKIRPIMAKMHELGGVEVCKKGHDGIPSGGNFNKNPYVQVYYKFINEPPALTETIRQSFQNIGYPLKKDVETIESLKNAIKNGGEGDGYTDTSDLMTYAQGSLSITARVHRDTKIVNRCEDFTGPNSHISAKDKEAIVIFWIPLEPR